MAQNTLERSKAWKHAARIAWRKVADEVVILDVKTAAYFSLDGAGLRVWELIGDGKQFSDISAAIAEEYDANPESIQEDCAELITKLRKEKLIEPA